MRLEIHHFHHPDEATAERLCEIERMLGIILEKIMSANDDLKSAIADLASQLNDNHDEIEALLTKITTPGTSDTDVQAAVTQIRSLIVDNKAEVDKAKAATAAPAGGAAPAGA